MQLPKPTCCTTTPSSNAITLKDAESLEILASVLFVCRNSCSSLQAMLCFRNECTKNKSIQKIDLSLLNRHNVVSLVQLKSAFTL